MKVLKFGGSSIKDAAMIQNILDILENYRGEPTVVVLSAMGDCTDSLYEIAQQAAVNTDRCFSILEDISSHHLSNAALLNIDTKKLITLLEELKYLVTGLTIIKDVSKSMQDTLLSFGELLSTSIFVEAAKQKQWNAHWYDARKLIVTDSTYTHAEPDLPSSYAHIRDAVTISEASDLAITQGFIAANKQGKTTTLGRGGSDYSASIIAAALETEALEIWTDATGIMSADPRVVPEAQTISYMSYHAASELATFGAKVVHPATIQPAIHNKLPVYIKNTYKPNLPGTIISGNQSKSGELIAIASKKNILLLQIHSSRMLNSHNFLSSMFNVFTQWKCSVDLVATSEVSVTVSLEKQPDPSLVKALEKLGTVSISSNVSIVCLVGHHIWHNVDFCRRVFAVLPQDIPLKLISLGASITNLSIVIPMEHSDRTVQALHKEFFSRT